MIYYHGSSVLFPKFAVDNLTSYREPLSATCTKFRCDFAPAQLTIAHKGDGKVKFGYGVYLTSHFKSAAHYSETKYRPATTHYVYILEVPELTEDNHIDFKKPVIQR